MKKHEKSRFSCKKSRFLLVMPINFFGPPSGPPLFDQGSSSPPPLPVEVVKKTVYYITLYYITLYYIILLYYIIYIILYILYILYYIIESILYYIIYII